MYVKCQDLQLPNDDIQYYGKDCTQIPYQVSPCYRDIRFDMVLRAMNKSSKDDSSEITSTQSDPPFPCSGDSTHLKLQTQ